MWSVVLSSWGLPINKVRCSDNKDHAVVEVEDTEVMQDEVAATKQSEALEEGSASPKQMAVESGHNRETNVKKDPFSYHSKDNDRILETPAVPFDSVSLSC